jgi:hypothetical protein
VPRAAFGSPAHGNQIDPRYAARTSMGEARASGATIGRLQAWAIAIRADALAFMVIGAVVIVSRLHYVRHGLCFNDPTWFFHFGRRIAHGDVPYRDFVFQVGPLPLYLDAGFQRLFGEGYAASLDAAIALTVVRVFIMWLLVKRLAGWPAAALITVFCAFEPTFATAHHWSTQYAQMFVVLSGLFFVCAAQSRGRHELAYLTLAGASAALVVSARQSAAITIGLALFAATAILVFRGREITRRQFIALWAGFAAGVLVLLAGLAIAGALGPAIQQMFLDAPQKKGIHGLDALLDGISGGSLVDGNFRHWWGGLLFWLGLPIAITVGIAYLGARKVEPSAGTVAMLVVPIGLLIGLFTRFSSVNFITDLPRTFLMTVAFFAAILPDRLRRWFGLEPLVALGLAALPLATDMALEMSFPGRGWGDAPSLVTGAIVVSLASARVPAPIKTLVCAALAVAALGMFGAIIHNRANPFAQIDSADGTLIENRYRIDHPLLRGMRIHAARKKTIEWLVSQIPVGSTCFVYGNMPVIYDLLSCHNPTAIDTTAADFITADDSEQASAALRSHPPDFVIAHEQQWMNPPLSLDLGGELSRYDGLNPRASRAIHLGVRAILDQYESLGTIGEHLDDPDRKQIVVQRDVVTAVRIYRRKR